MFSRSEIENCDPVEGGEATSGTVVVGLIVGCKGEAGVSSGEAGLEGIFAGGAIGNRKVTTEVVGTSKPEGVGGWKSSSGSERTERQSSQGERRSVIQPEKNYNKFKHVKLVSRPG